MRQRDCRRRDRIVRRRVLIHQPGQEGLVERSPVDADADRLAVLESLLDDGLSGSLVAGNGEFLELLREQRQVIPCQAGWASGHIAPNGDIWTCCIRAEPVGNLRQTDYDLRPIWFERVGQMGRLRKSIAAKECACPMANASYANMLLHAPTVPQGFSLPAMTQRQGAPTEMPA